MVTVTRIILTSLLVSLLSAQVSAQADAAGSSGRASKNAELRAAVEANKSGIIPELVKQGANPNATRESYSLLMAAVSSASPETVEALLRAGANPNQRAPYGATPLSFTESSRTPTRVQELLNAYGADESQSRAWKELTAGIQRGDHSIAVSFIRNNGKDKTALNDLLFAAALYGNMIIMHYTLTNGAAADATDPGGKTALMFAAKQGHVDAVKMLLTLGVDINRQSELGETALYDAANQGRDAVVRVLLAAGADRNLKTLEGKTPLDTADHMGGIFEDRSGHNYQSVKKLLAGS